MKSTEAENNILHISLPDELFLDKATILKEEIIDKITEDTEIIFDLSNVEYIDSTGIGMLVAISKRVRIVKIKGIHGHIKELFELTKLDQLFEYVK